MQTSFKLTVLEVIYVYNWGKKIKGGRLIRKYTSSSLPQDECKLCLEIEGLDPHLSQARLQEKEIFLPLLLKSQRVQVHRDNSVGIYWKLLQRLTFANKFQS